MKTSEKDENRKSRKPVLACIGSISSSSFSKQVEVPRLSQEAEPLPIMHRPCRRAYMTSSPTAVLDKQVLQAYSDFLLHDVGTGDGIEQADSPPNKLRTAPLMGVSLLPTLLHDGSATGVSDAIGAHKNEGQAAADAFQALSPADRQLLIDFVNSL